MATSSTPHPLVKHGPERAAGPFRGGAVRTALVVVAVLCLAAGVGPVWLVRVAVVGAVLAGVAAAWVTARQLSAERESGVARLRRMRHEHRDAFSAERHHNGAVVDELARRIRRAERRTSERDRSLRELQTVVADLETEQRSLSVTLAERDETITGLTGQLADARHRTALLEHAVAGLEERLVVELSGRSGEDRDAEVHGLPRRRISPPPTQPAEAASAS